MLDPVLSAVRNLPEPLGFLVGLIFVNINLLSLELFLYYILHPLMKSFKPLNFVLRKMLTPISNFGESFQEKILMKGVVEKDTAEYQNDEEDRYVINITKDALHATKVARASWTIIFTGLLSIAYIFLRGSLLGTILILLFALAISLGIMTDLEFHDWEITVFEKMDDIPNKYNFTFFIVLLISSFSYLNEGIGDILALVYGFIWSILYYKLLMLVCRVSSDEVQVTEIEVKLPPERALNFKNESNEDRDMVVH